MAATPITKSSRYWRPGISKCYYVPTMADYTSPTRVELDAGTDLSREVAGMEGWQVTSETIDTPDLDTTFVSKIPGATSADNSAITFYADKTSVDVRDILPRSTTGFVVWLDEGDTSGRKMDVFPIEVTSAPKLRNLTDAAQITVNFAVTQEPEENVTVPA